MKTITSFLYFPPRLQALSKEWREGKQSLGLTHDFFFSLFFFLVGLYPNAKITIIKNNIFDPIKTDFLLFIHTDNSTVPLLFYFLLSLLILRL